MTINYYTDQTVIDTTSSNNETYSISYIPSSGLAVFNVYTPIDNYTGEYMTDFFCTLKPNLSQDNLIDNVLNLMP